MISDNAIISDLSPQIFKETAIGACFIKVLFVKYIHNLNWVLSMPTASLSNTNFRIGSNLGLSIPFIEQNNENICLMILRG